MVKTRNKFNYVISLTLIMAALDEKRVKNGKLDRSEKAVRNRIKRLLKWIEKSWNKHGYQLILSDNEELGNVMNCTADQAHYVKKVLSSAGVINVIESTRQKKEGDFPYWTFNFEFAITESVAIEEKKKAKKAKTAAKKKYLPLFYTIMKKAGMNVLNELKELTEYHGVKPNISGAIFGMMRNEEIDRLLLNKGLTRDMLIA